MSRRVSVAIVGSVCGVERDVPAIHADLSPNNERHGIRCVRVELNPPIRDFDHGVFALFLTACVAFAFGAGVVADHAALLNWWSW
jgi:hypothetical protein